MNEAGLDAEANAELMLALVPCPACGKRNADNARAFVRASVTTCVQIAVGGVVLGAFFIAMGLALPAAGVFCVAVLAPAVYGLKRRSLWRAAPGAVVFFDGEAPDRPYTGKKCQVCTTPLVTIDEGLRCRLCGVALHRKKCWKRHAREAHAGNTGT